MMLYYRRKILITLNSMAQSINTLACSTAHRYRAIYDAYIEWHGTSPLKSVLFCSKRHGAPNLQ
jgi:hypothetical protein